MKKILLFVLLIIASVNTFAQFKVNKDGSVVASGDLTAGNVYTMSDIRLKTNVKSLSQAEVRESPLTDLMNVNIIKYNFKNSNEKEHYGVSAQELKEIYPDMVKEGADGHLAVNYIELVPILIRSVQELKAKLDDLQGTSEALIAKASATTGINGMTVEGNILYQNTPNPFKEQTIIRFRLADNVQNAAICIFDMTGKLLRNLPISSGMESVSVYGYELGEGLYLYSLVVNGQEIDTKKMIITK